MRLAMRNIFSDDGGGGGDIPYVTDGLIAMWDGEWNAGFGVHNAASSTLVNLVTGVPMTTYNGGLTNNGSGVVLVNRSTGYLAAEESLISDSADFTIDVVARSTSASYGVFVSMSGSTNSTRWIKLQTKNRGSGELGWGINYVFIPAGLTGSVGVTQQKTAIVHRSAEYIDIYSNGTYTARASAPGGGDNPYGGTNPLLIGRQKNLSTEVDGVVYRVALYSRALSSAEVAANNAVDVARFGTPTA